MTYASQRKLDDALEELDKAINFSHGRAVMIAMRGMFYGFAGKRKEALSTLNEVEKISSPEPVSPWYYASIYLSVGDKIKFFDFANKAFEQKDALMVYFPRMNVFEPSLGNDPRFHDILRKMKIEN
jgi:hypothetical protein